MNSIYNTGLISLVIQIITGLFDIYVLMIPTKGHHIFLKNLLWIEFCVQIVEAIFYIWLITRSNDNKSITQYRYYDWIITTPTMLFTFCMYLIHVSNRTLSFKDAILENLDIFIWIFGMNTLMLFFGYIAERGIISFITGAFLGFAPFFAMFYLIYKNFAKASTIGMITFWYFSSIWALYGVASILSYIYKNTMYNILDLFSKNFFGTFLAMVLLIQ